MHNTEALRVETKYGFATIHQYDDTAYMHLTKMRLKICREKKIPAYLSGEEWPLYEQFVSKDAEEE